MPRFLGSTCAVVSLGAVVAGCQSAPVRYANDGVHATYAAAQTGAGAVRSTGGQLYLGAGDALRRPFHDLNLMQDKIAPVLLRAEAHPYDLVGVDSCNDVLNRVAELDLALGPDVDAPKQRREARLMRGADFAASAALDAAGSAAEHFLPMRSTIKQITGATRYDRQVQHAKLAGTTRRSFLKAIGMEHNCSWPAAPLDFAPTQVADVSAPWSALVMTSPTQTGGAPVRLSSATMGASTTPARPPAALPSPPSSGAVIATARAQGPTAARVVLVSAASASHAAVFAPVHERLAIPSAAPLDTGPDQAWRPADRTDVVDVSAPISSAALATSPSPGAAATAPWSSAFVGGASARP